MITVLHVKVEIKCFKLQINNPYEDIYFMALFLILISELFKHCKIFLVYAHLSLFYETD